MRETIQLTGISMFILNMFITGLQLCEAGEEALNIAEWLQTELDGLRRSCIVSIV
jgi:hypothetical protein